MKQEFENYTYSVLSRIVIQSVEEVKTMYCTNPDAVQLWASLVSDTSETIDTLLTIKACNFVEQAVQARISNLLLLRRRGIK